MDPNTCLNELRELLSLMQSNLEYFDMQESDDASRMAGFAEEVIDLFGSLDTWLANGGLLPERWTR